MLPVVSFFYASLTHIQRNKNKNLKCFLVKCSSFSFDASFSQFSSKKYNSIRGIITGCGNKPLPLHVRRWGVGKTKLLKHTLDWKTQRQFVVMMIKFFFKTSKESSPWMTMYRPFQGELLRWTSVFLVSSSQYSTNSLREQLTSPYKETQTLHGIPRLIAHITPQPHHEGGGGCSVFCQQGRVNR